MTTVLVTGATGFVGTALVRELGDSGVRVRAATRRVDPRRGGATLEDVVETPGRGARTDWSRAFAGVDTVVHLAGLAHDGPGVGAILGRGAARRSELARHRAANAVPTHDLAGEASRRGVRRFVLVSSIRVHGAASAGRPFRVDDIPAPDDAYGVSKLEAEAALRETASGCAMEFAIVRPPLVYGPGVRGAFLGLLRAVDRGLPLPLGRAREARSLMSVWNLCDLIRACMVSPRAAGRVLLGSDGADISLVELVRLIAAEMGRRPRLVPIPAALLRGGALLLGRGARVRRLLEPARADISTTRALLDWSPPVALRHAVADTVAWYRDAAARTTR